MFYPPPSKAFGPVVNRISDVMTHITPFACHGTSRLAEDAGVVPSSISRLLHAQVNPSFALVARVTSAIERHVEFRIDPRDLLGEWGHFLTPNACDVIRCSGCLPAVALDEFGRLMPEFEGVSPGQWVTSRHPNGFRPEGRNE